MTATTDPIQQTSVGHEQRAKVSTIDLFDKMQPGMASTFDLYDPAA